MPLNIRTFVESDVRFALEQTAREGWDTTASILQTGLAHDPAGCFVAEFDGQPVAQITTTRYVRSAWIGNLVVAAPHRRHGLGEQLMRHAIAHLESHGITSLYLEADPLGVGIYTRLGFTALYDSPRLGSHPPHTPQPLRSSPPPVRPLQHSDLDAIAAFDTPCFGDDRSRLLAALLEHSHAAYGVYHEARLTAYTMVLPSAIGVRLGPCVATDAAAAAPLIDTVLRDFPHSPVVIAVPGDNASALQLLEDRRFVHVSSCLRMHRGPAPAPPQSNIYALANGALG